MVRPLLVLGLALASDCLSTNPDWDELAEEGSTGSDVSTSTTTDVSSATTPVGTSSPSSTSTTSDSTTAPGTTGSAEDETSVGSSTGDPLPDGRIVDGLATLFTFVFDEPDIVFDVSGVDPPLDLAISATSTTYWIEDGLQVDASSSLTTIPVVASRFGTQAFTIELWVDSQSANAGLSDGPRIVAFEDHGAGFSNFHVAGGSGLIGLNLLIDETGATKQFILNVDPGLRHIVFTVSAAGEVMGYEDGQLELLGTVPEQTPMLWQDDMPFVVANASDSGHPWLGTLGLLAIYERALSAAEVRHNFEQGR